MTSLALKKRITERIKKLPKEKLYSVDDFVSYLFDREDNDATRELLAIPGFEDRLKKAEQEMAKGMVHDFEKIKRDV